MGSYRQASPHRPGTAPAPGLNGVYPVFQPERPRRAGGEVGQRPGKVFFILDLNDDGSFVLTQRDTAVKFEDQTHGAWELG